MGEMWRSQEMQLIQMIVQNDAAHEVVEKLGELGIVEFRDVRNQSARFHYLLLDFHYSQPDRAQAPRPLQAYAARRLHL